jgi:hypothetical protein
MTPERERQHQFYSEITYANEAGHDGYAADVARKAIAEGCPEAEVFEVLGYELAPNSDAPAPHPCCVRDIGRRAERVSRRRPRRVVMRHPPERR